MFISLAAAIPKWPHGPVILHVAHRGRAVVSGTGRDRVIRSIFKLLAVSAGTQIIAPEFGTRLACWTEGRGHRTRLTGVYAGRFSDGGLEVPIGPRGAGDHPSQVLVTLLRGLRCRWPFRIIFPGNHSNADGAHAAILGYPILTRGPGRYQSFYPTVRLITPTALPSSCGVFCFTVLCPVFRLAAAIKKPPTQVMLPSAAKKTSRAERGHLKPRPRVSMRSSTKIRT